MAKSTIARQSWGFRVLKRFPLTVPIAILSLFAGCDYDLTQIFFHPDVEIRVKQSLEQRPSPDTLYLPDSFLFAVFGDPHIGKPVGNYLTEFQRQAESLGLAFYCVLGDLTESGEPAEFDSVAKLFKLSGRHYVTVGNHDLYHSRGWECFRKYFGASVLSVVIPNYIRMIFLDTGEGRLGTNQFQWLAGQLNESLPPLKLVLTHFPLYDDETPAISRLASTAERAKLQSLLQKNGVYAYCAGHIHGWRHREISGVHHFTVGTMSKALDFPPAGYLLFMFRSGSLYWEFIPLADGGLQ